MSTVASLPLSPYKGLAAFEDSELDALLFFGRERERDVIVANLLASKLTILYGPSGVGKSSVLRAAVARRLREIAPEAEVAIVAEGVSGYVADRGFGEVGWERGAGGEEKFVGAGGVFDARPDVVAGVELEEGFEEVAVFFSVVG